ncbi:predicted protein [Postia placenta Mad-698-R]|nr:predicted protein [Postia placenta Mad-698-R]
MAAAFLPQMLWGWAGASSHMTEDPGDQIEAADTAQTDSASAIRIRTRIRRVDQPERRPYALLHTVGADTIIARRHGFTITQGVRTSRCARRTPARAGAGVRDLAAGMETVADPRLLEWYGRRTCGPAAPRQLLRSARTPTVCAGLRRAAFNSRRDTQKSHRALCTGPYTSGRTSRLSSTNKHAHTGLGLTVHSCGREDRPDASWLSRACCDRPSALGAGVSASNCVYHALAATPGLNDFALGGLRLAVVTTDARGAALCPSLQCWWERLNVSIQATDAVDELTRKIKADLYAAAVSFAGMRAVSDGWFPAKSIKTFAKVNGAPGLRRALDHSTCKWSAALAADDARLLPSVTVRPDWRQRLWAGLEDKWVGQKDRGEDSLPQCGHGALHGM